MLTLNDGRSELWQWDTGRKLAVDADCSQVHFSNKVFGRSIDVDVVDGTAIIPDILLQTDKDLNVWAFVGTAENGYTKISKTFKVNRRNKPADYVFTPQEQITLKDATAILEEAKDVANDAIESAKQAEDSSTQAAKSADVAADSASAADASKQAAAQSASAADNRATDAENASKAAASSAAAAKNSAIDAAASKAAAETAAKTAQDALTATSEAKAEAVKAQVAAAKSASDAHGYMQTASGAATDASASAENAAGSKATAENSASAAARSEQAAGASKVKAAESEKAAKASEQAAAESAQAALESKTAAAISEGNAAASAKKAKDIADSLPEDYTTAVNEIAALKTNKADKTELETVNQQVANITPDDSTIGEKPWTSKKIVDSLCMPFEESGNPVQVYPVENYPLGVKVGWEPVQEGSGDPSPDNVRPINGRDSVTVERCGENLLNIKPFNKFTKKSITFEYVPDGGIHISGTATANTDGPLFPALHLPPGKYYGMNADARVASFFVVQRNGENLWLNAKGIFEILAGDVTNYWYILVFDGKTVDETIYPYIVPGTTAPTTYKPYIGQTKTLTLPETVYGGTLDVETGVVNTTWGHIASYAGEALPGEWISDRDVYSSGAVPTTGAQVVYKLTEPITIQLTPQQIAALSGVNTLYTDAGTLTVTGREDPKHTITELKNAIISLGGNV